MRETQEKKAQIQAELDAQLQAREKEVQALAEATAQKDMINKAFFDKYKMSIEDAYNTELNKINEVKNALKELQKEKALLFGV
ncbi:MAG: hypothetical protein NZZ41_07010 [Candidatus Dojkabacteria bacterium]|nr:hypothetical protein [Candidatus Dojkabacteria bacterium]